MLPPREARAGQCKDSVTSPAGIRRAEDFAEKVHCSVVRGHNPVIVTPRAHVASEEKRCSALVQNERLFQRLGTHAAGTATHEETNCPGAVTVRPWISQVRLCSLGTTK